MFNVYKDALVDLYKAESLVSKMEDDICEIARTRTKDKYSKIIHYCDGLEYKLIGVEAYIFGHRINPGAITIRLQYSCISKLEKRKRLAIERMQKIHDHNQQMIDCPYKIPAWKKLCYDISIQSVLDNTFRLQINRDINNPFILRH